MGVLVSTLFKHKFMSHLHSLYITLYTLNFYYLFLIDISKNNLLLNRLLLIVNCFVNISCQGSNC